MAWFLWAQRSGPRGLRLLTRRAQNRMHAKMHTHTRRLLRHGQSKANEAGIIVSSMVCFGHARAAGL